MPFLIATKGDQIEYRVCLLFLGVLLIRGEKRKALEQKANAYASFRRLHGAHGNASNRRLLSMKKKGSRAKKKKI